MGYVALRIPRVVETPRRSMQRLGFLKLLVYLARRQVTGSLAGVGHEVIGALTAHVQLEWDNALARYIRSALAEKTSSGVRRSAAAVLAGEFKGPSKVSIEIQDVYLGLGNLPSRRGRLIPSDESRFPHWGAALGLTRREPFDPLVRGNLLLSLVGQLELSAFTHYDETWNPLELSRPQRIFFLYALLERDLSIVVPLYEQLLEREGPFSDMDAGDLLPELYRNAGQALRQRGRGGLDTDRATQLVETAEAIEARKGKSFGKTVREQTVTPRLEPFVDLGLLTKPDPYAYEYQFTEEGRDFFAKMEQWVPPFFPGFGRAVASLLHYEDRQVPEQVTLRLLYSAWNTLKSSLGYAPHR